MAQIIKLFISPKSRTVYSLLSRLPSFSEGPWWQVDMWCRGPPGHFHIWSLLPVFWRMQVLTTAGRPSSPASCQRVPLPKWCVRRGHLCVDSNYIPVDLCDVTDHRDAVRLALLLAVCYTSVIPKQALSIQCLLIHSPQGVEAQAAALTVNVFPKVLVTASHPPHICECTHHQLHCRTCTLIELTSSRNLLMLRVKK